MALKKILQLFFWKMPPFLRKSVYSIYSEVMKNPIIILKAKRYLIKQINKINNINDAVDFAFSFQYITFSIIISQVKYEITTLLEILKKLKPKTIIEIGTAGGGTLFLFTRIADPKATIISVDLPGGDFGGGYAEWKIPLYRSFTKDEQKVKLLRANSHNPKTLERVKTLLEGKMVDFLFIDGDHTYEGVKRDFNMYSSLVKEGGIIAFHDIAAHFSDSNCNVDKFWNELKNEYKHLEIIKNIKQNWAGIGVIYL